MRKLIISFGIFLAGVCLHSSASAQSPCGVPELTQCPEPIDSNLPPVADMLTWSQKDRVIGFRNDYRSYPGDVFKRATPAPFERNIKNLSAVSYELDGHKYSLEDYIKRNDVTGLMIVKNGKVVMEYYGAGNTPTTLWTSRSVGKSVVSTLVGIALKEGKIGSLDDKIIKYNSDVADTAWANVSIRDLLTHSSGVEWAESYTDPKSDFSKLTQCEAETGTYACVHKLVINKDRKAYAKPGNVWSYSSGGAWLLGDTLEKAIGMPISAYLQQKIWQPYGMTSDGVWQSYEVGKHDVGAHGFNATLEDWAKFGEFILQNGTLPNGQSVLPDHWVQDASSWIKSKNSVTAEHPDGTYGYEWWNSSVPVNAKNVSPKTGLNSKDTLWALGIYGQIIVVNQKENIVFVEWSTWPDANPSYNAQPLEASLMFNAISNFLNGK